MDRTEAKCEKFTYDRMQIFRTWPLVNFLKFWYFTHIHSNDGKNDTQLP